VSITIDMARKILEASKQRARELRSPVSIAIVDAGGHLVLFERMMSPYGWATGNISIAKACTAVMFNQSTDSVAQWGSGIPGFASSIAAMTNGKFIMAAGGWPIRINGATVGGIGVSGGNAPGRDDDIARAGLMVTEALAEAMAPPVPAHPAHPMAPPVQQPGVSPGPQSMPSPAASVYMPNPLHKQSPTPSTKVLPENELPPGAQHLSPAQENPYKQDQYDFDKFNPDQPGGQS
jgi:uncharacterized protein GlcG (DUF336 family)